MSRNESSVYLTFECYTGNTMQTYTKIEVTLFSDQVYIRGITKDFEQSIPLNKIGNIVYNDWRDELGVLAFQTILPIFSIGSIYIYLIYHLVLPGLVTLLVIFLLLQNLRAGELNIIISNEKISLIGNKNKFKQFWSRLERNLVRNN